MLRSRAGFQACLKQVQRIDPRITAELFEPLYGQQLYRYAMTLTEIVDPVYRKRLAKELIEGNHPLQSLEAMAADQRYSYYRTHFVPIFVNPSLSLDSEAMEISLKKLHYATRLYNVYKLNGLTVPIKTGRAEPSLEWATAIVDKYGYSIEREGGTYSLSEWVEKKHNLPYRGIFWEYVSLTSGNQLQVICPHPDKFCREQVMHDNTTLKLNSLYHINTITMLKVPEFTALPVGSFKVPAGRPELPPPIPPSAFRFDIPDLEEKRVDPRVSVSVKKFEDLLNKAGFEYKTEVYDPPQKFTFEIPTRSGNDTLRRGVDGKIVSKHGEGTTILPPKDIHKIYNKLAKVVVKNRYTFYLSETGKWVFHQPGVRACTAGVSTMLLLDLDILPKFDLICFRNISQRDVIIRDLTAAGIDKSQIQSKTYKLLDKTSLQDLSAELTKHSMRIDFDTIGGHVAVLDKVDVNTRMMTIRDPYNAINFDVSIATYIRATGEEQISAVYISDAPPAETSSVKGYFPDYVINWNWDITSKYKMNYTRFVTYKDVSRYSSLMPWHLMSFEHVLNTHGPSVSVIKRVVDGTAHIGVDTVFLSNYYNRAETAAVEIDPDVCEILKYNLKQQLDWKVDVHCTDFLTYMKTMPSVDLVYLDPPWGGPGYRKESNVVLKLGDELIEDVVASLLKKVRWVIVKTPLNFTPKHTMTTKHRHVVYKLPPDATDPTDRRGIPSYSLFILGSK